MTCKQFGQRPSDVWGIEDESIALAFDLAAGHCLFLAETELEAARLEAMAAVNTSAGMGGSLGNSPFESGEDYSPVYVDGELR